MNIFYGENVHKDIITVSCMNGRKCGHCLRTQGRYVHGSYACAGEGSSRMPHRRSTKRIF